MFEQLGFQYSGPLDGHDLPQLVTALAAMREARGPRLLHIVTHKGHGYARATAEPIKYHAVTPFDPLQGTAAAAPAAMTYTDVFGHWLCTAAERDERVVAVTPAMREGSGLVKYAQRFPDRYFDVGIAEQHSVTFAAGLATRGCVRSSPSTRHSCSVPSTSWSTTSPCSGCRSCSRSIARAWSVPTARRTTAASTLPICAAFPIWS